MRQKAAAITGALLLIYAWWSPQGVLAQQDPCATLGISSALVQSNQSPFGPLHTVNRASNILCVKGFGAHARRTRDIGQRRSQARLAARLDAQGKMAQIIGGVRVTSKATLENTVGKSIVDLIAQAKLQGFRFVAEEERQFNDGSIMIIGTYQTKYITASELIDPRTVEEMLSRIGSQVGTRPSREVSREIVTNIERTIEDETAYIKPRVSEESVQNHPLVRNKQSYTGLIIDVRNTGARVVTFPQILSSSGHSVYGLKDVNRSTMLGGDIVKYASSIDKAQQIVGTNALRVKAQGVSRRNSSHIVISDADANRVAAARSVDDSFIRNAQVVLVY